MAGVEGGERLSLDHAELVRQEFRMRVRGLADGLLTDAFITFIAALRERNLLAPPDARMRDIIIDEWAAQLSAHGAHARELLDQARISGVDSLYDDLAARLDTPADALGDRAEFLIRERQELLRSEQADRDVEEPERVDPTQE